MEKPKRSTGGRIYTPTARLLAAAFLFWILAWSLWRIGRSRTALVGTPAVTQLSYYILLVIVVIVALGYVVIGYSILRRGRRGASVLQILQVSKEARRVTWVTAMCMWLLAVVLWALAVPLDVSLVSGPVLILILSGLLLLLLLFKIHCHGRARIDGVNARDDEVRPANPSSRRGKIVAIAVITSVVLATFWEALFNPQLVPYGLDLFWLHYSLEQLVRQALAEGHLPLWNPYIFSGSPALAHPQYLVIYPPQMLLRLLPINLAFSWGIALHIWVAGLGMFFLARSFKLYTWIALLCALVYMLNSGLVLRVVAGHAWLLYALSWFPLAWLLLIKALNGGRAVFMVSASIIVSLIILTGHPAFPIYLILFLTLYSLYMAFKRFRETGQWSSPARLVTRFALILGGALGFSAIQVVPTAVMARQISVGSGYSAEQANYLALSATDLTALLIPHTYAEPAKGLTAWEMFPYFGILVVLLIPFALHARLRHRMLDFLSTISMLSVVIAFGTSLGVYSILYDLLPVFRIARLPSRSLVMLVPAVTLLGGLGLQAVQERHIGVPGFRRLTQAYLGGGLFVLSSAIGVFLVHGTGIPESLLPPGAVSLRILLFTCAIAATASLPFSKSAITSQNLLLSAVVLLAGLLTGAFILSAGPLSFGQLMLLALFIASNVLLLVFLYRYGPAPMTILLFFVLLLLDLGAANLRHLSTRPPPEFDQDARVLLRNVPLHKLDRVLSVGDEANHYALGRVAHVDGYNTGILAGYDAFLRAVTKDAAMGTTEILAVNSIVNSRALDFLGARYVIRPRQTGQEELHLLASRGSYGLYLNNKAMPRAFVVYETEVADDAAAKQLLEDESFDYSTTVVLAEEVHLTHDAPRSSTVTVEEYVPAHGELSINVHMSDPGILVLSEPYYSERRIWVNGEEADALRANLGFIAVALQEGEHRVELRYVPSSLLLGAVITSATILISLRALLPFGLWSTPPRKRQDADSLMESNE